MQCFLEWKRIQSIGILFNVNTHATNKILTTKYYKLASILRKKMSDFIYMSSTVQNMSTFAYWHIHMTCDIAGKLSVYLGMKWHIHLNTSYHI